MADRFADNACNEHPEGCPEGSHRGRYDSSQATPTAKALAEMIADLQARLMGAQEELHAKAVCDCHTWPTIKEFHEYTVAVEAERDAALRAAEAKGALAERLRILITNVATVLREDGLEKTAAFLDDEVLKLTPAEAHRSGQEGD